MRHNSGPVKATQAGLPLRAKADFMEPVLVLLIFLTGWLHDPSHQAVPPGSPLPGTWVVQGRDRLPWQGLMDLERQGDNSYRGCIEWRSGRRLVGHETVVGRYDPKSRQFTLQGVAVLEPKTELGAHATFRARVSEEGKTLEQGRWFGAKVATGTWRAWHESVTLSGACARARAYPKVSITTH
jgi:hypothetical protein